MLNTFFAMCYWHPCSSRYYRVWWAYLLLLPPNGWISGNRLILASMATHADSLQLKPGLVNPECCTWQGNTLLQSEQHVRIHVLVTAGNDCIWTVQTNHSSRFVLEGEMQDPSICIVIKKIHPNHGNKSSGRIAVCCTSEGVCTKSTRVFIEEQIQFFST